MFVAILDGHYNELYKPLTDHADDDGFYKSIQNIIKCEYESV